MSRLHMRRTDEGLQPGLISISLGRIKRWLPERTRIHNSLCWCKFSINMDGLRYGIDQSGNTRIPIANDSFQRKWKSRLHINCVLSPPVVRHATCLVVTRLTRVWCQVAGNKEPTTVVVPAVVAAGVYILTTLFTFTTVTCPAEKINIFIINILSD